MQRMNILTWIKELFVGWEITPESLKDKRKAVRIRCSINAVCHGTKEEFAARIVEMGKEGIRLEVPRKVLPGAKYGIELRHRSISASVLDYDIMNIWGEVLWCRKKRFSSKMVAGIRFLDTSSNIDRSWVRFILKRLGFDSKSVFQKRHDIRVPVLIPLKYAVDREKRGEARVANIGIGGILMETLEPIQVNAEVHLKIGPYGRFAPIICRGTILQCRRDPATRMYKMGVRFLPLGPKQVQLLGRYILKFLKDSADA